MTARLTPQAERDIDRILDQTLSQFGIEQFRKYQGLLGHAIADIAERPCRPDRKRARNSASVTVPGTSS